MDTIFNFHFHFPYIPQNDGAVHSEVGRPKNLWVFVQRKEHNIKLVYRLPLCVIILNILYLSLDNVFIRFTIIRHSNSCMKQKK